MSSPFQDAADTAINAGSTIATDLGTLKADIATALAAYRVAVPGAPMQVFMDRLALTFCKNGMRNFAPETGDKSGG